MLYRVTWRDAWKELVFEEDEARTQAKMQTHGGDLTASKVGRTGPTEPAYTIAAGDGDRNDAFLLGYATGAKTTVRTRMVVEFISPP